MERTLCVYILASPDRRLYTGVTSDLPRRMLQHHEGVAAGSYTRRQGINRLVYLELVSSPLQAIQREKQIKSWTRRKRIALIESVNPDWLDLSRVPGWMPPAGE